MASPSRNPDGAAYLWEMQGPANTANYQYLRFGGKRKVDETRMQEAGG